MSPTEDVALTAADQAAIRAAKTVLRNAIQFRRETRPAERRNGDDAARSDLVEDALSSRMPDTVAAYLSMASEPGTLRLIAWLAAHEIRILLPVLSAALDGPGLGKPAWAPYEGPDALRSGQFSILEPTSEPVPAEQLPEAEMIICPAAGRKPAGRSARPWRWLVRPRPAPRLFQRPRLGAVERRRSAGNHPHPLVGPSGGCDLHSVTDDHVRAQHLLTPNSSDTATPAANRRTF